MLSPAHILMASRPKISQLRVNVGDESPSHTLNGVQARNLAGGYMRKALCVRRAAEVMSELGVSPPPPVEIEKVARDWGLAVDYVKSPSWATRQSEYDFGRD